MRVSSTGALKYIASVLAAVPVSATVTETVDRVKIITPTTTQRITVTADPVTVTAKQVVEISTVVYSAPTTVHVNETGTIITTISSTETLAPVSTASFSTTSLSATIDPSTFSDAVTLSTASPSPVTESASLSSSNLTLSSTQGLTNSSTTISSSATSFIPSTLSTVFSSSASDASSKSRDSTSTVSSSSSSSSVKSLTSASVTSDSSTSSTSQTSSTSLSSSSTSSKTTSTDSTGTCISTSAASFSVSDLFSAVATNEIPSVFSQQELDFFSPSNVKFNNKPFHSNKFYSNLVTTSQNDAVFTWPYSVFLMDNEAYPGIGVSHVEESQRVFGGDQSAKGLSAPEYYANPIGIASLVFSAQEYTLANTNITVSDSEHFSVQTTLTSTDGDVLFNFVEGMGFVTGTYSGSITPTFYTALGINKLTQLTAPASCDIKYAVELGNGYTWYIYGIFGSSTSSLTFSVSGAAIVGSGTCDGCTFQVTKVPGNSTDSETEAIDSAAGMWPTSATLTGSASGSSSTYSIEYSTSGSSSSGSTLLYALPHHVKSFTSTTSDKSTGLTLASLTKGYMTGYVTNTFEMTESLSTSLMFDPWSTISGFTAASYSKEALKLIAAAANSELQQDIVSSTNLSTNYFGGKALDKYAYILLVVKDILQDDDVAKATLATLKEAYAVYTQNAQEDTLMYDTLFHGVTSTGAQNGGDSMTDYGAPYYNDHHFHYGYFVHAAAVIGYVDSCYGGTWATENKEWVNSLIRDVANPSSDDDQFPVYRYFDWFQGHSWAGGLFAAGDGRNEESTSEDYNFSYGMKLWGRVIGDAAMEARGDLMLAVQARSLNSYILLSDDNDIQPAKMLPNKVAGITFENKIDHTTYFGTDLQYIQGIHMIPVTPASSLIRGSTFVKEEWESLLSPILSDVTDGWRGILLSNLALYDPASAYEYFSTETFTSSNLDNGASLTWYLAYSAGINGGI